LSSSNKNTYRERIVLFSVRRRFSLPNFFAGALKKIHLSAAVEERQSKDFFLAAAIIQFFVMEF
jgi:hypothetical protein